MEDNIKKEKKFNLKNIITIENLLCFLIIICPILDAASFLFRNYFNTNISISTFIRPIIPIIAICYIFFKDKLKPHILMAGGTYFIYAICHLYIFYKKSTGCAYGSITQEIQYLVNYTFMIMNLFIYIYFFVYKNREKELKNEDGTKIINKLKLSVLISFTVYIVLMYISLITGTSSYTYSEVQIGYKGWFESGNSIGTIMLLEMFIILPNLGKNNKTGIRIWTFMTVVLAGAYLCTLLGTRTGLFGFIIVILMYCIICIINSLIKNSKLNKKALPAFLLALVVIGIAVIAFGSKTIERRKDLQERENQIIDTMTGKTAHVTGDIVDIVKKIKNNEIDEGYMPESMQKTYLELYDIANEKQIQNTNMRALQFIYHSRLIKNQDSIPMLLFGNGYMAHFYEMIFEMEVPAFLYNFGVIGFFLYFMPFLAIAMYGTYMAVKKIKNMNIEFMMSTLGLWFAIFISFLSGYTFFNSSSMMIIITLATLIFNGCKDFEDNEMKIYEGSKKEPETEKNVKKIIFGITGLTLGGAERVLVDIANKLTAKYDVTIFTIYSGGELEKELDSKIKLVSLFDFKYNDMSQIKKKTVPIKVLLEKKKIFEKYVKSGEYFTQIAFLEGPITRIFSVKDKKSTKIAWIHNDISKVFGKGPKSRIKRILDRNIYEKFDTLVFVSIDNLDKFNKVYDDMDLPHEKVINNYINCERILKLAEEKLDEQDNELFESRKKSEPTIVQVSRLVSQKAIDRLIKVHSKLIKQGYNHKIIVIGDGPLREKLEKQIQEEGVEETFKLIGARENPYPIVKKADFFCLLSNFEGYPMVVEEAKILNKFILTTNTATREALIDYAGKSHIVSNSEEGVEEALKFAVKNYKQKDKQNSQYEYKNDRIIGKIEKMIEENSKHPDRVGKII